MTSSLVGSEMCIRDRLLRAALVSTCVLVAPPVASGSSKRAPDAYLAVSHTHLTLPTICSV
eukprot:11015470-Prorocentrum_lima.AAC.1